MKRIEPLVIRRRLIAASLPKLDTLALNVRYVREVALVDFLVACTALTSLELIVVRLPPWLCRHAAAQPTR